MIKITFPDGSVREYNEGVTGLQIAESISSRLAQDVLACGVNGETMDLSRPINEDANIVLYKSSKASSRAEKVFLRSLLPGGSGTLHLLIHVTACQ